MNHNVNFLYYLVVTRVTTITLYWWICCRDSNRKTKIVTAMDRSQHVCVGRRDITELRLRTSAIAHDQPNWCLHRPGHRKNRKRDVKKVPNTKSNSSSCWTRVVRLQYIIVIWCKIRYIQFIGVNFTVQKLNFFRK